MTAIISYGSSVSREGIRHANKRKTGSNLYHPASSSNLAARRTNDRDSVPCLTAEQMELENEALYLRRHGEPTRQLDGSIVWIVPKRAKKPEPVEEYDRWRPTKIKKVSKWLGKRIGKAARGQSDTQGPALQSKDNG